jgi:rhamnogalacturonan endolyase
MMQVPHATDNTGSSNGSATTWSVLFDLPRPEKGTATLRLAFAGTEARSLTVTVNNQVVGTLTDLPNTSAIHRDSDRGFWEEKDMLFDASLLKQGRNVLQLTVPAGPVMNGVQYDYLRLEVNEKTSPSRANPAKPLQ